MDGTLNVSSLAASLPRAVIGSDTLTVPAQPPVVWRFVDRWLQLSLHAWAAATDYTRLDSPRAELWHWPEGKASLPRPTIAITVSRQERTGRHATWAEAERQEVALLVMEQLMDAAWLVRAAPLPPLLEAQDEPAAADVLPQVWEALKGRYAVPRPAGHRDKRLQATEQTEQKANRQRDNWRQKYEEAAKAYCRFTREHEEPPTFIELSMELPRVSHRNTIGRWPKKFREFGWPWPPDCDC